MRHLYGIIFSGRMSLLRFERKMFNEGLESDHRFTFDFDVVAKEGDHLDQVRVMLFHSHDIVSQLRGRDFIEVNFKDYFPDGEVIEMAKTRLTKNGSIYVLDAEIFRRSDVERKRPSILL